MKVTFTLDRREDGDEAIKHVLKASEYASALHGIQEAIRAHRKHGEDEVPNLVSLIRVIEEETACYDAVYGH